MYDALVNLYVKHIKAGTWTIEKVPAQIRDLVQAKLDEENVEPSEPTEQELLKQLFDKTK